MGALALIALITLLPPLQPGGSGLSKVAEVLRLRKVQIGLTAIVLMLVGQFSAYTFIAPFLDQSVGIAGPGLSVFLLTYGVAGFFGNLLGGWLASRHLTGAIITAAAGMAIALTILMISETPGMSWLSVILWGVSFGALPITTQLYVFSAAPEYKESIAALSVSIGQVSICGGLVRWFCCRSPGSTKCNPVRCPIGAGDCSTGLQLRTRSDQALDLINKGGFCTTLAPFAMVRRHLHPQHRGR